MKLTLVAHCGPSQANCLYDDGSKGIERYPKRPLPLAYLECSVSVHDEQHDTRLTETLEADLPSERVLDRDGKYREVKADLNDLVDLRFNPATMTDDERRELLLTCCDRDTQVIIEQAWRFFRLSSTIEYSPLSGSRLADSAIPQCIPSPWNVIGRGNRINWVRHREDNRQLAHSTAPLSRFCRMILARESLACG